MPSQTIALPHGVIEYTLRGAGPVLLVCHGTSSDCYASDGYAPLLESGFAVLTPSRPGYGRTPLQTGPSARVAADALVALLDSLGIETCAVMAIPGGGPTGISLAAAHPERVRRLVLMAAITQTQERVQDPIYRNQKSFYGPLHGLMLGDAALVRPLVAACPGQTDSDYLFESWPW